ncbi:hypothetical protein GFD17_03370 [Bifidobacterium sp. SMB2]|uniref:Putative host cell surface-exposed lipoprotein Ltp-like HTH region domain-containing protein n=1 Tax=Bifidobacterium saimiriisciurei TaxID=2661627 RepID=A0ABX0CFX3_9BIFI|nr:MULTISPECIES: Ltp family lipoprotein [Bifidobacterium]NEG95810.1 hypothetical protein [Bifidobacterium sp. SMB2]NEH11237.1 hypothetical protein [Bifidobacterium saimiriisciurei]
MTNSNGAVPNGQPAPQRPTTVYQPPSQGPRRGDKAGRPKKPFWKKWWFWLIAVVAVAAIATSAGGSGDDTSSTNATTGTSQSQSAQSGGSKTSDGAATQKSKQPSVPAEYTSALRQADTYANTMHMSKQGVYDQLTSEYGGQFSKEAAQYAIDNVKADWNANALAKAKTYQEDMAMSPEAIRDQLTSESGERFTADEANYAIEHLND